MPYRLAIPQFFITYLLYTIYLKISITFFLYLWKILYLLEFFSNQNSYLEILREADCSAPHFLVRHRGVEPPTIRLRVCCSTNWANGACILTYYNNIIIIIRQKHFVNTILINFHFSVLLLYFLDQEFQYLQLYHHLKFSLM